MALEGLQRHREAADRMEKAFGTERFQAGSGSCSRDRPCLATVKLQKAVNEGNVKIQSSEIAVVCSQLLQFNET